MSKILIMSLVTIIIIVIIYMYYYPVTNYFSNVNEDFHFVHISKNGGTSMEQLNDVHNFHFYNHDFNADLINSDKIYAVIRDPISRFVSAFYFAKKGGFEPNAATFKDHPIHNYETANDFINALRKGDTVALRSLYSTQEGIDGEDPNVVYWTQMYWLYSKNVKKLVLMDFANLNANFKKLTNKELKFENVTGKKEKLTDDNVNFLKKLYEPDYKLYEYVKKYQIFNTDTDFVRNLGNPGELVTPLLLQHKYLTS